jgi:SAM-dependent methyltransferase
MIKLNLGCGFEKKDGFTNVDLVDADIIADLNQDWNFVEANSVDYALASNIFEHLPDKIHTMNELYKILKPGGIAEIYVPSTDGRGAFQDPQHCSYWNINSFEYFSSSKNYAWHLLNSRYGFKGDFKINELVDIDMQGKIIMTKAVLEKV